MGNITHKTLVVYPNIHITYVHLILANNIAGYGDFGLMYDLGLHNKDIYIILSPLDADIPPAHHTKTMTMIKEYANLFSAGTHNFRLLQGIYHHLKL